MFAQICTGKLHSDLLHSSDRPRLLHNTCEKRPTHVNRDQHMWKETNTCEKRPTYVNRDLHAWKETYMCAKRPKNVKRVIWRDPQMCQETYIYERDICTWKETYIYETYTCEKRSTSVKKKIEKKHTFHIYDWVISHINESCHTRTSHVTNASGSWHVWMRHVRPAQSLSHI